MATVGVKGLNCTSKKVPCEYLKLRQVW